MAALKKHEPLSIYASDSVGVSDHFTLQSILVKVEKNLWAILLLILLNFFSPFLGFCLPIWPTIIISWGINTVGIWVGYRAITKLKEIRIFGKG